MRILLKSLAGLVVLATSSMAGVTGYIKLGDIKGEAKDKNHQGWSELLFWEADLDKSSPVTTPDRLRIGKPVDAATPLLAQTLVTGDIIPQARIRFVDSSNPRSLLFAVRLFDVQLTSQSMEIPQGEASPFEKVGLRFQAAVFADIQPDATGAPAQISGTFLDIINGTCRLVGTGTSDNDADSVDDAMDDDDDNDGVDDRIEAEAKLNPLVFDSHLDNDKDGSSNGAEAQAGTDVFDARSRWEVSDVKPKDGNMTRIHWVAKADRGYRIFAAAGLNSKWIEVANARPGTDGPTHADVERLKKNNVEFYKVEVYPILP